MRSVQPVMLSGVEAPPCMGISNKDPSLRLPAVGLVQDDRLLHVKHHPYHGALFRQVGYIQFRRKGIQDDLGSGESDTEAM